MPEYSIIVFRIFLDGLQTSDVQVREAEEYIRRTPLTDDSRPMLLDYFKVTFQARRKFIIENNADAADIMKRYPLITKCREAVMIQYL